jgi:hypothetical protein
MRIDLSSRSNLREVPDDLAWYLLCYEDVDTVRREGQSRRVSLADPVVDVADEDVGVGDDGRGGQHVVIVAELGGGRDVCHTR